MVSARCESAVKEVRSLAFDGCATVGVLRESGLAEVPREMGVYVLACVPGARPPLLERSPAGHFKGNDPTLPIDELSTRWVCDEPVVYIGKAGGTGKRATLRSRLRQYMRHGEGRRVGHWGGRSVWQIACSDAITVYWRRTPDEEPRCVERRLIEAFVERHGRRPFANRAG